MVDAVLIPDGILESFIRSLDTYMLGDLSDSAVPPLDALVKYNLQSNLNPVEHVTHTPFIKYLWKGGTLKHDQIFTNNLEVITIVTSESAGGPQKFATALIEDLFDVLMDADSYSLPVKDLSGRTISVHELSPNSWDLNVFIEGKQNYKIVGTVYCTVTMRR